MNKKLLPLLVAVLFLFATQPVQAKKERLQDIDFGDYSCRAFLADIADASEEDAAAVLLWLDGYLSGVSGDTVLSWRGLEQLTTDLIERCRRKGNEQMLEAARKVGID